MDLPAFPDSFLAPCLPQAGSLPNPEAEVGCAPRIHEISRNACWQFPSLFLKKKKNQPLHEFPPKLGFLQMSHLLMA